MLLTFLIISLSSVACLLNTGVDKESDIADIIIVHNPSLEAKTRNLRYDYLHDFGAINLQIARMQHVEMQKAISSNGAHVYELTDVLLNNTGDSDGDARKDLLGLASQSLSYDVTYATNEYDELKKLECNRKQRLSLDEQLRFLKDNLEPNSQQIYRLDLRNLTSEELVEIILTRPKVELHLRHWFVRNKAVVQTFKKTTLRPLEFLYYVRDQQITTRKGNIMLKSRTRSGEEKVIELVLKKLGIKIAEKLDSAFAEGGDFIPYGNIAFFGVGVFSDYNAVKELMRKDLFGHTEIAIVRDNDDFHFDRMHLDTFFNIVDGRRNVLLSEEVLSNPRMNRYVDLYSNKVNSGSNNTKKYGNYFLIEKNIEFGQFLKKKGFRVTTVTHKEQLNDATNFLNIGNNTIVTPYCEPSYVARLKNIGINVICVKVDELLKGYGGVHCMTQVVHRLRS